MNKQADAKKNLDEIRADIENDPDLSEEERVALRSVLHQVETPVMILAKLSTALRKVTPKRPNILRRLFGKIRREK